MNSFPFEFSDQQTWNQWIERYDRLDWCHGRE